LQTIDILRSTEKVLKSFDFAQLTILCWLSELKALFFSYNDLGLLYFKTFSELDDIKLLL